MSFNREEIEKKLTLNHKKFLNVCINLKLPNELIRFILNEFIAKYNPRKLDGKNSNILQALSYLKLNDKDFMKFLFLTEYYQDLSVEESLWNNFPYPFKESFSVETQESLENQDLDSDALSLSYKEKIGAKIHNMDYNAEIIFYKGKRRLGSINIPYDITPKDLKYMLVFELQFPIEKNLQGFVEEATDKLLTELKASRQIPKQEEVIVPVKTEIAENRESEAVKLTENRDIYYKISYNKPTFIISFSKENRDFGKITGPDTISAPGMFQLVKNETMIPTMIDEDELMFVVLEMYNKYSQFIK